jgi:two-component system OmpR family sensor kinase
MLRRAQVALALQTALAVAVVLALVGAVAVLFVVHDEGVSADRLLAAATSPAARDDVTDPPPGVTLFLVGKDGGVLAATPGKPAGLLDRRGLGATPGHPRYTDRSFDGGHYRVLTIAEQGQGRLVQAALDRGPQAAERRRLLGAALVAGLCGIVAAGVVGALLARRAVAPLGEAIGRQRRFVADASHELRTPLTLLHTRAQLLRRDPDLQGGGDLGRLRAEVVALERDAARMGEVVEDLLVSAELPDGHGERSLVDLGALAAEVADAARGHAAAAGVALVTELELAWVQGAPSALRRVVVSLVDNAVGHARHPGGEVWLGVTVAARQVVLEVRDNGPGLDPAVAARLFERFAHGPATDGRRRFGLGLALVREVVDAHGGRIEAAGEPGHGATFRVELPAAPPPPGAGRAAPGASRAP